MNTTRNLIAIVIVLAISTTSFAQFVDFSGQTADDPTWTGISAFGGTMTVSFSSSFSEDTVRWAPQTKTFSNPAFVNLFGDSGSLITLVAQDEQLTATTTATMVFSSPLPIDARLVVFDIDGDLERMALMSNDGAILTPVEIESNDPDLSPLGPSAFGLWSQNQQRILSVDVKNNDREAYVFDVGGLSQISAVMSAGEAAANWIGLTVPEPRSMTMLGIAVVALGIRRRRS